MGGEKDLNKIGWVDIVFRDKSNTPIFKLKGRRAGEGIKELENFCKNKLGIHPFDTKAFEKKIEEKYGIKGVGFR